MSNSGAKRLIQFWWIIGEEARCCIQGTECLVLSLVHYNSHKALNLHAPSLKIISQHHQLPGWSTNSFYWHYLTFGILVIFVHLLQKLTYLTQSAECITLHTAAYKSYSVPSRSKRCFSLLQNYPHWICGPPSLLFNDF
jgi:hypothetical protein